MATGVMSAGAFGANAITAGIIADGAIDAATFAGSAINAAAVGADTIDLVWDELLTTGAHTTLFSAGRRLRNMVLRDGTAISATTATIQFPGPWSSTEGIYEQNIISIVDGTGAGQTRLILEYDGANRIAYVDRPWDAIPDSSSEIEILPFSGVLMTENGRVGAAAASSLTLASAGASSIDDTYNGSMIVIASGTGEDQARLITDYVGSTNVATVSPDWTTTPDTTSTYKILPIGRSIVNTIDASAVDTIWDEVVDGSSITARQSQIISNTLLAAKVSGGSSTTATFRDIDDTKDRIVIIFTEDGDKTTLTLSDLT
jgi:hypothetical protein